MANGVHLIKDEVSEEVKEVNGYSIVQADDMEAIKVMLADHPHFMVPNASIEVFELMQ